MTYVLYAHGHRPPDVHPRCHVVIFDEAFKAKVWLDRMMANLPEGFKVRSDQLDAIRNAAETGWQLPDHYAQWILRFKYGTWEEVASSNDGIEPAPEVKREARACRPAGYVTITELCNASDVAACDARAALRASGRIKPPYGWSFSHDEVLEIKRICGIP